MTPLPKFRTILADPPWQQPLTGSRLRSKGGAAPVLPYQTMSLEAICAMKVQEHAAPDCHCWLWTTNSFLEAGFQVMRAWGFRYLAPIHWIKPSGMGNYVIHRSQTLLLGYREKCVFDQLRYFPNLIQTGDPVRHSQKPNAAYELIEKVSHGPRLEIFARNRRDGWYAWGNQVESGLNFSGEGGELCSSVLL